MRRLIIPACLLLASCSGNDVAENIAANAVDAAQAATSGTTVRSYDLANFRAINLLGSARVEVTRGSVFSVRAEGGSDALDRLQISVSGSVLTISGQAAPNADWTDPSPPQIFITMPDIVDAHIAGSGNLEIDQSGDLFTGVIDGSGNLTIDALATRIAAFDIGGSGTVTTAGTTQRLRVAIGGSGDFKGDSLTASMASIALSGSGDVHTHVAGPANVEISGSGNVDLGDAAKCSVEKTGSGTVTCGS